MRGLEERLQHEINKANEQIQFLKDCIKKQGIITQLDSMFEDWKNKKGIFR